MEYERIHKVQNGIISPSKLRMKLMGSHNQKKKEGSNSNSSRTSPSKLEDAEFVMNSLLTTNNGDFDEEVSSLEVSSVKQSGNPDSDSGQGDQSSIYLRDGNAGRVKMQQFSKGDTGNSSSVHPVRALEEENLDYDSNASSSSFEFHKGERSMHNPIKKSLLRPMSSKWNDAEKWIMNKQNAKANYSKKNSSQSQVDRVPVRVAPECVSHDNKLSVKRVDFCQPSSQVGFEFDPPGLGTSLSQVNEGHGQSDLCPQSKDLKELENKDLPCTKNSNEDTTGVPGIRAVSMRDMGTEMTPIPSQEPSRTSTPIGATTPLRSPTSSIPSTPRRGPPTSTPTDHNNTDDGELRNPNENGKKELTDQDLKDKTRREIVALGVQLGKMNIAAWASKDDQDMNGSGVETIDDVEEFRRIEFKREEIKIQAWESQQKAKLEAETRRIEAQVEQIRAHAQAKMVKKVAMARQRSEEKRAKAEARKKREAERTAARAEYIRQTGRVPSNSPYICCGYWT
ncbi:hypothetical protein LguiA_024955 [Lonicera macranthoides]